jgi:asparagine synthase (glutamine-hydrolysing)
VLTDITEEEAARRVRATVEEAVRSRLMSDVPLGAFLSGGVDSSIVVACMARETGRPVQTFSVGFTDGARGDDELPYARLVAERWRTDHHELVVEPDMVGLLPSIVRHHGEPFADTSAVPTRYLCEMTRKNVKVAPLGRRGRRGLRGYRRYVWAHVAETLRRLPGPAGGRRGRARCAGCPAGRRAGCASTARGSPTTRRRATCASSATSRPARRRTSTRPSCARASPRTRRPRRSRPGCARPRRPDLVGRLQNLDVEDRTCRTTFLAKVDIASMTHALEARAPLCDHHVVELGAALPGRHKLHGPAAASTSSSAPSPISCPRRS